MTTDRRYGVNGSTAIKTPCRVCATSNITLSGEQTIDGVAVVSGDRVLVTGQTTAANNGVYDCGTGLWTRSKDWDGNYDIVTGTLVYVTGGTSNSGWYYVATTGTITIGTTSVTISLAGTALASVTAYIQTLLNDADAATARTTLGAAALAGLSSQDFSVKILTAAQDATINGIEIGRGAGNVDTNTAFGDTALDSNTTGGYNTAVGSAALTANTTGGYNTAVGSAALTANTTGSYNTAVGFNAMDINTTGGFNTAVGSAALTANTTGGYNTAVGYSAMDANTIGSSNTAFGDTALDSNTTGSYNTAVGFNAMDINTTGGFNTAIGILALGHNVTGNGNTGINPCNAAGTYAPVFSPITENNRISMGSTGVTNAYVQVAWTVVSDARDKRDIGTVPHGLDFISRLKPVSYKFKMSRDDDTPNGPLRYGFLAQDILPLEGENPVIIDAEYPEKLRMVDQHLIAVLVKAVQELNAEFQAYKATHP